MFWLSLLFAIGFALVHYFSGQLIHVRETPRSRFLSLAGGVAVAYVFLHLLPELNEYQRELEGHLESGLFASIENHILVVSMLGLAVFYGLERLATQMKNRGKGNVFWIHMALFVVYNFSIGYVLAESEFDTAWAMTLYFLALGIHFVTVDQGLRHHHRQQYDRRGRLWLSLAVLAGWGVGVFSALHEVTLSMIVAFLAGGIILNVMKEELPEERDSSFRAFAVGLIGYALLLLAI